MDSILTTATWKQGEVIDSDHWLDGWVAPDGANPAYGKLRLRAGEFATRPWTTSTRMTSG